MKYYFTPSKPNTLCNISTKINIVNDNDYHKIIANQNIKPNELLIEEFPKINLFGEKIIDRAVQTIEKYITNNENELYPRSNKYNKTNMVKNIHDIINNIKENNRCDKIYNKYTKDFIEFYYAKYLYNSFEGNEYGPLTLPISAKLNHSCNENASYIFDKVTGQMKIKSIKNIKKNEEIFINYLSNKQITDHKEYLKNHYGFICNCK